MRGQSVAQTATERGGQDVEQASAGAGSPPGGRRVAIVVLAMVGLAAVVFAVHSPALTARAMWLDDYEYVVRNPLVHNPGWASAGQFLGEVFAPSTVGGYYQPLTMISLMLDWAMGARPDQPWLFHLTSLLLHAANAVLIAVLMYLLFGELWPGIVAGLLFGLHPLTVESIAWIAERKTVLATCFSLAAIIAYLRYTRFQRVFENPGDCPHFAGTKGGALRPVGLFRQDPAATSGLSPSPRASQTPSQRWPAYALCVVLFVLALLAKPTSTPLPLLLLLLDIWPLKRLRLSRSVDSGARSGSDRLGRVVGEKLPLLAIAAVASIITCFSQATTFGVTTPVEHPIVRVPLILCHNTVFYLLKIVCPIHLSTFYPFPEPFDLSNPILLGSVIGTCLLLVLLVVSLRWTRVWLIGWLIFFVAILPTMGILGFMVMIAANKYTYLPMLGLLVPLTWLLVRVWRARAALSPALRVLAGCGLLAVLAAETTATRKQLSDWQTSDSLRHRMLEMTPKSGWLHYCVGLVLYREGRADDAIAAFRRAIELSPDNVKARNNLGLALAARGDLEGAIRQYEEGLRINAGAADVHNNLGMALAERGDLAGAIAHYQQAIQLDHWLPDPHYNLANVLQRQGQIEEAIRGYREALARNPSFADAYCNLGTCYLRLGRPESAIRQYREALRLDPASASAYCGLGNARVRENRPNEAVEAYREALRLNPRFNEARVNFAMVLANQGDIGNAIAQYSQALQVDPADAEIYLRRGELYLSQQRFDPALRDFTQAIERQPQAPRLYHSRAIAHYGLKQYDQAWDDLAKCRQAGGQPNPDFVRELSKASGRSE